MFSKEPEMDKMVDCHSMAGPFDLIPSQSVFKSQARTAKHGATMCLSILGYLVSRILYGGWSCVLLLLDESIEQLDLPLKMVSYDRDARCVCA